MVLPRAPDFPILDLLFPFKISLSPLRNGEFPECLAAEIASTREHQLLPTWDGTYWWQIDPCFH